VAGELVLVLDCGSTNVRAVAVSPNGDLVAQASRPNQTAPQPGGKPGWLIWDLEELWGRLAQVAREVSTAVGPERIEAVTVTTWGADGAPVRRDGTATYPPIAWQCPRTQRTAAEIVERVSAWELFRVTGYQMTPFNTLLRMIWLRENAPGALDEAHTWLMMPGLLAHRLTGRFHIEPTSASTSMVMDLGRRDWSAPLLELAGLDPGFFPEWSQPGQVVGHVTRRAGEQCNLPPGTPVVAGGHDTQFALIGSGARPGEAVLSSGTWEILEVRVDEFKPNRFGFEEGIIIEADALPGWWNPQVLMMGSAVLEWIREALFADRRSRYHETMMAEAGRVPPGADGVTLVPSFFRESGPTRKFGTLGTVLGLSLQTGRAHLYRAALEGLSFQMRGALRVLRRATGVPVSGIRVVGGGSRNDLWNQIRADVTGLPVTVTVQKEATALGAAMVAFVGVGRYSSLDEARKAVRLGERSFQPGPDREAYEGLYERYAKVPALLKGFYRQPDQAGSSRP